MPDRPLPFPASVALLLAGVLVLSACGGEESAPSGTPSTTTKAPATAPAAPPPAVDEPGPSGPAPSRPEPGVTEEHAEGIVFVEGFAKGVEAARHEDEVLFVYVGRRRPT